MMGLRQSFLEFYNPDHQTNSGMTVSIMESAYTN